MSHVIVNGYKIEVDDGIYVDGKLVDPKFDYRAVFTACFNAKPKTPEHVDDAEAEERSKVLSVARCGVIEPGI